MSKKILYIDCQFFQTPAWDRGMGKYTMTLLKHVYSRLDAGTGVTLIFTKNLPKSKRMLSEVKKNLPDASILNLNLETTHGSSYQAAAKHNKAILEKSIDHKNSRATFFIPCLFQEPTASIYPGIMSRMVVYYDAIPLLYYHKYKHAINYDNYLQRYQTLLESDSILTISHTVKDDLAVFLGIEDTKRRIVSIDGAAINGPDDELVKPLSMITGEYILLTTSDDIRKNNNSAVLAVEQLRKMSKRDFKLVITSSFSKSHRAELEKLSPNLIFTGNVTPSELGWLYKNATTILFPSEYEGLGLPILEGVNYCKPIVCSNITVFREISNKAFYFFDPLNVEDITVQLNEAINKKNWAEKISQYESISKSYTWERSANLFIKELKDVYDNKVMSVAVDERPKIAILCPTPSGYSSVGRTVQEIHDAISTHFQIDYYFEDRKKNAVDIRPNYLSHVTGSYGVEEFNAKKYAQYDTVIYHIGNSEYHFETIQNALYLPGIAIIHDTKLSECFGEMTNLGYMSPVRYQAEARLNDLLKTDSSAFLGSLLNNQIGAIVHSRYAEKAAKSINLKDVIVQRSILALPVPQQKVQAIDRGVVHIGLAGVLSGKRKGIDIVKDLAQDPEISANVKFHIFGFSLLDAADMEELKSYDNINVQTNLSDLAYQTLLANLDIMINYRSEYKGETSSSVLEAMRYGCTVMVNGSTGWFKELPDNAVAKVNDPAELEVVLRRLISSSNDRFIIGAAAKEYVAKQHRPKDFGITLKELFNDVISANTANSKLSKIIRESKNLKELEKKLRDKDI
jgi:glycosyltransferase involved in cell wall biosynthesis